MTLLHHYYYYYLQWRDSSISHPNFPNFSSPNYRFSYQISMLWFAAVFWWTPICGHHIYPPFLWLRCWPITICFTYEVFLCGSRPTTDMSIPFRCSEFNRSVCYKISGLIHLSYIFYYYITLHTVHFLCWCTCSSKSFPFKDSKGHFHHLEHCPNFVCLTQGASDNDYLLSYFNVPTKAIRLHIYVFLCGNHKETHKYAM